MGNDIGFRVFKNVERVSADVLEAFRGIPASNIADQMGRLYCTDSSIKAFNKTPLLGSAFTVKVPQGDNLMIHYALELAEPGDVLVIDGWVKSW